MAWVSGYVRFDQPLEYQRFFNGDIFLTRVDDLIFHGVVTEGEGKTPVSGAVVNVLARSAEGKEISLSHSYSGGDGHYLVPVNKKSIPTDTTAIIVRAVADNLSPD